MYSQSSSVYQPVKSHHTSKKAKDFKAKINQLCDQFNHISRNKDQFLPDELFNHVRNWTISFISLAAIQKPKKIQFQDVLTRNLALGINCRNKRIVFFNIKLTELYLKSQLNLNLVLKQIQSLNKFYLLQTQFHENFSINLALVPSIPDQKLRQIIQKTIGCLFKFIDIQENEKHQNFINMFLSQSVMTDNFSIYFQITSAYFQRLRQRPFHYPFIDVNFILKKFFGFNESKKSQFQQQYRCILVKYYKLFDVSHYLPYLVRDFQNIFMLITQWTDSNVCKQNQFMAILFYNVLTDIFNRGLTVPIPLLEIKTDQLTTAGKKLYFFMKFFITNFKNQEKKSLSQIDLYGLQDFLTTIEANINNLIIPDHNFIRVVDKIVIEIEKIKRNFLNQSSTSDKILILKNQKNLQSIEILTKLTEIQNIILSNKVYLALDNFKNSSFFATSGLIEIMIQSFSPTRQNDIGSILKKWVNKIISLNLQTNDIETFFSKLLYFLTKRYTKNQQNPQEMSYLFKCFSFIMDNIPANLSSNLSILNCWFSIIKRLVNYFQQKSSGNLSGNQYFQKIQGLQNFVKKITQSLCKNAFSYFENLYLNRHDTKNIEYQQQFHNQKDLLSFSVLLFCLNHEILTIQEIKNFLKIFSTYLQNEKIGKYNEILKKDIFEKLETYIFFTADNKKIHGQEIDFLQMQFLLNFYCKLGKISNEKKYNRNDTDTIYSNLRSINFIFNLKSVFSQIKNCNSLIQLIQNLQESVLGCSAHVYVDKYFEENFIQTKCKQKNLEILLDVLVKKIYFTSHPQTKSYDHLSNSINKTGFGYTYQSKQNVSENQQTTKRQRREKHQKQFQKNVIIFENSCIVLGKGRNLLTKVFGSIQNIIQQFQITKDGEQKNQYILLNENEFQNFQNISNLLGFTWNILWMLKICDMPQQLTEILKLRLGIYQYFSSSTNNDAFIQFQLEKLSYFGLIHPQSSIEQPKSLQQKILKNRVTKFQIENVKSRIQPIIYFLNNLTSSKNFKTLIMHVAGFIFQYNRINSETMTEAKVKFFPLFQPVPLPKRSNYRTNQKQLFSQFLTLDPIEVEYPLMTKIIRKLIFFVKKNNQLSEIRALLSLITSYFSKTGLGIFYNQVVDLWLIKNVKISILKVIDCYQIFLNNFQRNQYAHQSSQKFKIFSKIDRMLCNKRRSVSTFFTLKTIVDLLKQIRDSEIPMNYNICQIIMKQFKQQFNLYNYQAEALIKCIYPNQALQNFDQTHLKSSELRRLQQISKKVVLQKQFLKNLTEETFNYAYESLFFLNETIVKFVLINFETGKIAESLIGFFVEFIEQFNDSDFIPRKFYEATKLVDQTLIKLVLTMLQFNYEYKTCVYESVQIESIYKTDLTTMFHQLQGNKMIFAKFYENFESGIQQKLRFLNPSQKKLKQRNSQQKLNYPLSIIYPLRNCVYNISLIDSVLITKVDMFNFDHSLSKIQQFIDNDSEILCKQKSAKDWWKARNRLNREMGKIAETTDLGAFDVKVQDHLQLRSYCNKSFSKFIYSDSQETKTHVKTLLEKFNLDMTKQSQILNEINKIQQMVMVNSGANDGSFKINQSILILTVNRLSIFPFQKTKPLQRYTGVYRVPSIKYIIDQQKQRQRYSPSYSIKNLSYAVNIHNDLKGTERKFLEIKENASKKTDGYLQWQGMIGQLPCKSQYLSYFSKDVYLYMGHGSGMGHLKERQFYRTNVNSISMLFGCSSINMDNQCSQLHGIPLILLKNNCPALLGANWDITDADTDLLTMKIFQRIETEKQIDMSVCVQQAKKSIKLSNLNGSAIVVYGLPCKLTF